MKLFSKFLVLIFLLFLILFPERIFAASITSSIPNQSSSYSENDEITVHVIEEVDTADGTIYYLAGTLRKDSGNYCGFTFSEGAWVKYGSDGNKFFKITMQANKWEGDIKIKIDYSESSCRDSGAYKLTIKRFTDNSGTYDPQNELSINFNLPTPTPTPSPTPTHTPTPTPTKTPTPTPVPTSTPTPTPAKTTPTPTPKVTINPSPAESSQSAVFDKPVEGNESILGNSTGFNNLQSGISNDGTTYSWGKLFILMGVVLVSGACGILLYNNYRKKKSDEIAV